MRALVQDEYGPASALAVSDVPEPDIGDDQVLVRVEAVSLDRRVVHLVTGVPYVMRAMGFGVRSPKHRIPRSDFAGVVVSVGASVTDFAPGDRVYGVADGAFAEYAAADADQVAHTPAGLTVEQAAATPYGGLTALQALRDHGRVAAGQRVLVIGASGAVGSMAVQIAAALGASVTAVCSTRHAELVLRLGADRVIDYREEDFADGSQRYDVVIDIAGGTPLARLRRALEPSGRLVIIGDETGGRWFGLGRQVRAMAMSPFVSQHLGTFVAKEQAADLRALNEMIESSRLDPVMDRAVPLEDAPGVLVEIGDGRADGRAVATVNPE
jgi:NADPH:quinone reductase-like Zn-dependent oxidoreductase